MGPEASDFSNQVHDFDPGLDNGLFWTVPVDEDSLKVSPGSEMAALVVNNLEMEDYFNVVNALNDGNNNSATVSFKVHWAPGMKRIKVRDQATDVAGEFVMNTATMRGVPSAPARPISRARKILHSASPAKWATSAMASSSSRESRH